ncbi:hypothetical protein Hanom_Chr16g01512161 [Helianthus anomalus]
MVWKVLHQERPLHAIFSTPTILLVQNFQPWNPATIKFIYTSEPFGRKTWRPKEAAPADNGREVPTNIQKAPVNSQTNGVCLSGNATVREGELYVDLFKGKGGGIRQGVKTISVEGDGSVYPLHCVGRSIFGLAKNIRSLSSIKQVLDVGGLQGYGLSYIGGLSAIITLSNKEAALAVMETYSVGLSIVFSKFNIWYDEDLPFGRIVSLRISGVPFLLRDKNLFDRIGGMFGVLIVVLTL